MKLMIPLLMLLSLALSGCTSGYRSVTQTSEDGAYIRLSGNFMGTVMTINDQAPLQLTERHIRTFQLDNERVALIEVDSGTQQLRITRDGTTLVQRELYVSEGNTIAVRVP